MIEKIKQELVKILGDKNLRMKKFREPSKNEVFIIISKDKKYFLKIYKVREDRGNIKSFNREKKAIDYFSPNLDEVEPLIASGNGDTPWILMRFFEGLSLKSVGDFGLYKKSISLMIKLHALKNTIKNPTEIEISEFYNKKLQEVKQRVKKYLPEKYDRRFLTSLVDNFSLCYGEIYKNSNNLIHGDFIDRNILVGDKTHLIDFENSRVAPLVEDLIFFIDSTKLNDSQKRN